MTSLSTTTLSFDETIRALTDCLVDSERCVAAMAGASRECVLACLDCSDALELCIRTLRRGEPLDIACTHCAHMCERFVRAADEFDNEHTRRLAASCERSADLCRQILGASEEE